jgi:adhesin HecA-like repeat protein
VRGSRGGIDNGAKTDNWIGKSSADWGTSAANWSIGFPTSNSNVDINTTNILTIGFGGGDDDDYVINSLTVGNDFFDISGSSLTILGTASFADSLTQTGGTLSAGGAVTISGTGTLTGGAAEGNTAFSISGTIFLANYTLGGSSVLNNVKTTNQTGQISLGDDTGIDATINNEKGAVFDIAGDYGITQGAGTARFVNAAGATLEKTGGSGTSLVGVNLTDTGAIVAATGTLEFGGPTTALPEPFPAPASSRSAAAATT